MSNVIEFTIKGIDKASGPVGKISSAAGKAISIAAKLAAATVATAGAVVGFTAAINSNIDKQAKFAKRIGESVTELSTYHHVADLAGISTETFNMATQRMTRRVAEAAQGTGEAAGALKELGINAKDFNNLSLDKRMETLAGKFSGMSSESDRLRLAFKLFDSEGTAMIQMLGQGSGAMKAAAEDARFLGIIIGEQAAANAEAFMDSMTRVKGSIKGVSMGIAEELSPVLTGLMNRFADLVATARPAIVAFAKTAITNVFTVIEVIKQVYTRFKEFSDKIFTKEGFQDFVDGAVAAMKWLGDLFIKTGPILAAALFGAFKLIWETFNELGKWAWRNLVSFFKGESGETIADLLFDRIPAATEETRATIETMWADVSDFAAGKTKEASDAFVSFAGINIEAAQAQAAAMIASISEYGEVSAKIQEETTTKTAEALRLQTEAMIKENLTRINNALEYATEFEDIFNLTLERVFQNAQTYGEQTAGIIDAAYQNLTASIGSAVADAIVDGEDLVGSMGEILKAIAKQVISSFVTMAVQRTIMSMIFGAASAREASTQLASGLSQVYTNSFASAAAIPVVGWSMAPGVAAANTSIAAGGAAAAMAAGAGIGSGVNVAGARADGGSVAAGRSFIVGERGPELFTPVTNGEILPNNMLGGGGNGGMVIESLVIHVLENATSIDALLSMDSIDIQNLMAEKLIPAMDSLARQGLTPEYIKRK